MKKKTKISFDNFLKFGGEVHEKFPEILISELEDIWIEYHKSKPEVCQLCLSKEKWLINSVQLK
jgi:hypothetical protein